MVNRIANWMFTEQAQDAFADKAIYRLREIPQDMQNRYHRPVIDPGASSGRRFSYEISRDQFVYDCLLRAEGNDVVLKVLTMDDDDEVYQEFRGIASQQDLFNVLTKRVYHLRWFRGEDGAWECEDIRPHKVHERLQEAMAEMERELSSIEDDVHLHHTLVVARIMLIIGTKHGDALPADIIAQMF
jgi:hypothetical protein